MGISWGRYEFDDPVKFATWSPVRRAGIYAIAYKADPINEPTRYIPVYFGKIDDTDHRESLSTHNRFQCWIAQAGSRDNIYVSAYYMPRSSESERAAVREELIRQYDPACNGLR